MAFCRLGTDYIGEGFTPVDNIFISRYLPSADAVDVKVYLYGLTLTATATDTENTVEKFAVALKLSEERIIKAFRYWEEQGLVSLTAALPMGVTYRSAKRPVLPIIKHDAKKYCGFIGEVNRLFPEKILTPNEQNELVNLLHFTKMEDNALLMIIKYCLDVKGGTVSTPYILAVANDWAKQGLLSFDGVNEHIASLESNSEALREIFKALGSKATPYLEDRQLYLKWIAAGYALDGILEAAKALKRKGGMERLDRYIDELTAAHAFSVEEIKNYRKNKDDLIELTIKIVKNLGGYYASLDPVIETYTTVWRSYGFSDGALFTISHFCFLRSVRTLEGMSQMVEKFYKLGLLTAESINAYVKAQIAVDESIKEVFSACRNVGVISNRDRDFYHTWVSEWGFSHETVLYVAAYHQGKPFPLSCINRTLGELQQSGTTSLEGVKKKLSLPTAPPAADFVHHEYTDEQLKDVLVDFANWHL